MGALRLILALSVVAGHGDFWHPFFFVVPPVAVASFYIISGFYMALVISEKYGDDWRQFMLNRVARLYPAYLFFTLLYGAFLISQGTLNTDPIALLLTFTLVGQDVLHSLVSTGAWERFGTTDIVSVIPIPQAWSVALELELYLIAAFAFRSARWILITLAVGIALRILFYAAGLTQHPLGISILPNALVFFALGGASYLIYRLVDHWQASAKLVIVAAIAALMLADCYACAGFWGAPWRVGLYGFYVLVAVLCPFLFSLTKDRAADRFLGDLSYPVYLSHIMVFAWAAHLGFQRGFVLAATILVSLVVVLFIERPMASRNFRNRLRQLAA